jgi:hypothetical protein
VHFEPIPTLDCHAGANEMSALPFHHRVATAHPSKAAPTPQTAASALFKALPLTSASAKPGKARTPTTAADPTGGPTPAPVVAPARLSQHDRHLVHIQTPTGPFRQNVTGVPRRGRGRPRKTADPLTVPGKALRPTTKEYVLKHPSLDQYRHLEHHLFSDPQTKRIYSVLLIYYDPGHKKPMAFRRSIDDDPEDPQDSMAFPLGGPNGIAELVAAFRPGLLPTTDPAYATPWPQSEAEMLHLQQQDGRYQPILAALPSTANRRGYAPASIMKPDLGQSACA